MLYICLYLFHLFKHLQIVCRCRKVGARIIKVIAVQITSYFWLNEIKIDLLAIIQYGFMN